MRLKPNHILLLLSFLMIATATLQAQESNTNTEVKPFPVSGGIKTGVNLSYYLHKQIPNGQSLPLPGAYFGGFVNFDVTHGFSIQAELLFEYKVSQFRWFDHEVGMLNSVGEEIAIYAMYQWKLPKKQYISVAMGPFTEFGFYNKLTHNGEYIDMYAREGDTEMPVFQGVYSGFGIMLGYEINGWQINAGYKMSYLNILDENSNTARLYPQNFTLGAAYRFRK